MGKLLVPGKGSGVKILHCNHGKIFGSRKRFWSIHVRKTWPDFEEIHQNLQKKHDALLMHF
jgi:acetone carboxylase gamma subunit